MLCERCTKNQATIHLTQVINGEKTEMSLCPECAKECGAFALSEVTSLFSGLLDSGAERAHAASSLRCSRCGLDYGKFKQTGMLGCATCYKDFRRQLQPVLQRIHGRLQHEGHIPATAGEGLQLRRQIEAKRREMQSAIDQEEFERAAKLRDELRALQLKMDAKPDSAPGDRPKTQRGEGTHANEGAGKAEDAAKGGA